MGQKHKSQDQTEFVDDSLRKILSDKKSGSEELLYQLNKYLSNLKIDLDSLKSLLIYVEKNSHDFACIQNYLKDLNNILNDGVLPSKDFFLMKEMELDISLKKISGKFEILLPQRSKIITLSNSKTLSSIFRIIRQNRKEIDLIISESRPLFEGRIMAEQTTSLGIHTTLITEADIPNHISSCDFAVIGADSVLANGNVVNKKGSNLLALLSRHYKIPFIVLCRKSKFSEENEYIEEEKDRNEIWNSYNNLIEINNFYFDVVKKELISQIITD